MKRYIKSAAMKRSDIGDEIQGRTLPLIEALAQLYLFPNSECINHWRKEVWNKFPDIPVLKRSNKTPKPEFILERGWYRYEPKLKAIMHRAEAHEYNQRPEPSRHDNVEEFKQAAESYMFWLAETLSFEEVIDPIDCYNKLEELGL